MFVLKIDWYVYLYRLNRLKWCFSFLPCSIEALSISCAEYHRSIPISFIVPSPRPSATTTTLTPTPPRPPLPFLNQTHHIAPHPSVLVLPYHPTNRSVERGDRHVEEWLVFPIVLYVYQEMTLGVEETHVVLAYNSQSKSTRFTWMSSPIRLFTLLAALDDLELAHSPPGIPLDKEGDGRMLEKKGDDEDI